MKTSPTASPKPQQRAIPRILATSVAALLALGLVPPGVSAATETWTGATNQQWSDSTNWSLAEPTLADDAVFPTPVPGGSSNDKITLSAGEKANSLTFHDTYVLAGKKAATLTLNPASGGDITVDTGSAVGIQTKITGNSSLTKLGGGTLSISSLPDGNNSYSGGTVLDAGTLDLDHIYTGAKNNGTTSLPLPNLLGSGTLTINGGTIGTGIQAPPPDPKNGFGQRAATIGNDVVVNHSFSVSNVVLDSTISGSSVTGSPGKHLVNGPYVPGVPIIYKFKSDGVAFAGQRRWPTPVSPPSRPIAAFLPSMVRSWERIPGA